MSSRVFSLKLLTAYACLVSVIMLWAVQIDVGFATVSIYLFLLPFFLLILGVTLKDILVFVIVLFATFTLHSLQLTQDLYIVNSARTYIALITFPFVMLVIIRALHEVLRFKTDSFYGVLRLCLYGVFLWQLYDYAAWFLDLGIDTRYWHPIFPIPRMSGPFHEPSHVAIGLSPAIFLIFRQLLVKQKPAEKLPTWLVFVIFFIAPSASAILVAALAYITISLFGKSQSHVEVKIHRLIIFPIFSLFIFFMLMRWDFFAERIGHFVLILLRYEEITASHNLSSLVLFKGYEMASLSLKDFPFGVGFLNMEFLSPLTNVSALSDFLFYLNAADGASLLFKTVAEFGFFGLVYVGFVLTVFIKNLSTGEYVRAAIIFGFIAAFFRGTSYFDGAPVLAIALSIIYLFSENSLRRR